MISSKSFETPEPKKSTSFVGRVSSFSIEFTE